MTIVAPTRRFIGMANAATSTSSRWRMLQRRQLRSFCILTRGNRCEGNQKGGENLVRSVGLGNTRPIRKRGHHPRVVPGGEDERHMTRRQQLCDRRHVLALQIEIEDR